MSDIEDYNKKIEVIKSITDDQIKVPQHVPVGIYIMEAQYLYSWCQDDKEELTAKGLDWTVVEDLTIRCGALREAESQWQIEQELRRRAEKIWVRESPKGKGYRSDYRRMLNKRSPRRNKVSELEPGYVPITAQE